MKRYRGVVVFTYYQERTVEAENEDQAREIMYNEFHMRKSDGESEIQDFEEITGVNNENLCSGVGVHGIRNRNSVSRERG